MACNRRVVARVLALACLAVAGCEAQPGGTSVSMEPEGERLGAAMDPAPDAFPRDDSDLPTVTIRDGVAERVPIDADGSELHVVVTWVDEGRVRLVLESPSGEVITPRAPGVTHERGPRFEDYRVSLPAAGAWTALLTGVDVPVDGLPVRLTVHQGGLSRRSAAPALHQRVDGATVALDLDVADVVATAYLWEFGDGEVSRDGPSVSHTFGEPGIYRVSVAVQIDDRWRVLTADEVVEVR